MIFTDDKDELLRVMSRPDDPMSATELAEVKNQNPSSSQRRTRHLSTEAQLAAIAAHFHSTQPLNTVERDMDNDR